MTHAQIPTFDLYAELEVSERASTDTIEAAWRSLVKRNHPDTAADPDAALARIKRLNEARDWLTDRGQRLIYDRSRLPGPIQQAGSHNDPPAARTRPATTRPSAPESTPPPRTRPVADPEKPSPWRTPTAPADASSLDSATSPLAYARRRLPLRWLGAITVYTAIFAGATVGLVNEMASGRYGVWDYSLVLGIVVVATLVGFGMLTGIAYVYVTAIRLERRRQRSRRR